MAGLSRRHLLQGAAVAGGMLAVSPRSVRAQGKPDKLVYIGENQGGWKRVLMEEVGPAFEKATGIKVEFTMMPVDAWRARLKAELGAGSSGIDIAQWSVGMAGWMSPHLLDHEPRWRRWPRAIRIRLGRLPRGQQAGGHLRRQAVGHPLPHHDGHPALPEAPAGKGRLQPGARHLRGVPARRAGGEFTPRALRGRHHGQAGLRSLHEPRLVAVLGRRTAGGLEDRRGVHQRLAGRHRFCNSWAIWWGNTRSRRRRSRPGVRRDHRWRTARSLRDGADVRALRHVDLRPRGVQDRRALGLVRRAGPHRQGPEPHVDRRALPGRAEIREASRLVAGVHPHGLQQGMDAAAPWSAATPRRAARCCATRRW